LAALVGVNLVEADPVSVMRVNTLSTLNLFDWFVKNSAIGGRLLLSSSSEVYSGGVIAGLDLPIPTPETVPLVIHDLNKPRSSYALTKMWGEAYSNFIASKENVFIMSVRYHNVYGPRMGYSHVIPQIVSRVLSRENPFRIIAGGQTRAFCWIEDAVQATHLIMEAKNTEPGSVVNIGNEDEEIEIGKLYDLIFDLCNWTPERVVKVPSPEGSVSRRCPDTKSLQLLTGYKPNTPLEEGLKKTVLWYKDDQDERNSKLYTTHCRQ
jgi:nucleoside-diphosphate-sugar epimerase